MTARHYQILIVGGGPGGITVAASCRARCQDGRAEVTTLELTDRPLFGRTNAAD